MSGSEAPWMLGQNIHRHRKKRKLTQAQLGEVVGVTRQTVSRWETGECMPERSHLLALALLFGVSPNRLFER